MFNQKMLAEEKSNKMTFAWKYVDFCHYAIFFLKKYFFLYKYVLFLRYSVQNTRIYYFHFDLFNIFFLLFFVVSFYFVLKMIEWHILMDNEKKTK